MSNKVRWVFFKGAQIALKGAHLLSNVLCQTSSPYEVVIKKINTDRNSVNAHSLRLKLANSRLGCQPNKNKVCNIMNAMESPRLYFKNTNLLL